MKTTTVLLSILLCLMLPMAGYATEKTQSSQTPGDSILSDNDVESIFDAFYAYLYKYKNASAKIGTEVCLKDLVDTGLLSASFVSDESKTKDAVIVIGPQYERRFYFLGCEGLDRETPAKLHAPIYALPENKSLTEDDAAALRSTLDALSLSPLAMGRGNQDLLMNSLITMVELRSRFDIKYGKKAKNELAFLIETLKRSKNISCLRQQLRTLSTLKNQMKAAYEIRRRKQPFKTILDMFGRNHVADLTIEYLSAGDMGLLIKAFEAGIPGVRIVFFTTKPPGQPGSDNAIGMIGLSLVQAMVAESLLRTQEHDYLAQYGTTRFFRLEPSLALWHTLTGERGSPDRWDITLLSEITSPRHLAKVNTTTEVASDE